VEALRLLGRPRASLSVVLADDRLVRELNRDFRESDQATDVLSFSFADAAALADPGARLFLGEIYISVDTARRPYTREVAHLTLHGLLHLLGHDHAKAAQGRRMRAEERRLLRALGPRIRALQVL
jgi:probable rRNA maturation factor